MNKILKIFLPTLLSYITFVLINTIDGIFIGNILGQEGQVAMGLVSPIILIVTFISFSLVIGGNTFIGHAIGKKDKENANKIFNHVLFYGSIILLIVIAILFFTLVPFIYTKIDNVESKRYFLEYIIIFLPSMILLYVCTFLNFIQRVVGKPIVITISSIISLSVNVIFNTLFAIVLNLGILGIALSSTISFVVQGIFLIFIYKKQKDECFKLKIYRIDFKLMNNIVINGASDGIFDLSNALVQFMNITLLFMFVGEIGSSYLYILNTILMIWLMVFFSLSDSLNPLISVEYGKKNFEKIKYYRNTTIKISILMGIVGYGILFLIKGSLLKMFGITKVLDFNYLMHYSNYYFLVTLVFGVNQTIISYFTSIGESKLSLYLGIIRNIFLIILITLSLTAFFGEVGIWLAYFVSESVFLIMAVIILIKNKALKML